RERTAMHLQLSVPEGRVPHGVTADAASRRSARWRSIGILPPILLGQPAWEFTMRTLAVVVSVFLALGVQGIARAAPGDELYARPGRLIAADGTRLNFYCTGTGSPTVVFDSGWGDWAPVWMIVQPAVTKWTRACSYDRAGAGYSDAG